MLNSKPEQRGNRTAMPKFIRNKMIIIAVLTAAAIYFALPSLTKTQVGWWNKLMPGDGLRLGLDLQGGMNLILKVNLDRAVQTRLELSITDLRQALREKQVAIGRPEPIGANRMQMPLTDPGAVPTIRQVLKEVFPALELSAQTDGYIQLGFNAQELADLKENAVTQSLEIIRNRIDQFGVTEPVIVRQGADQIVLQLPGIKDPQRAVELVGRTAQLEFKLVDPTPAPELAGHLETALRSGRLKGNFSHRELNQVLKEVIPAGDALYLEKRVDRESGAVRTIPVLVKQASLLTGEAIRTARMEIGGRYNEPYVALTFSDHGAKVFDKITTENVGRQLSIILDDRVQSAPVIQERITGGRAQITGNFTPEEANDLAIALRAGALPAPVDIVQNLTVGPSLGRDSIQKGVASALLGTILVVVFMVIYYRLSGMIANAALLLNLLLMLAALSLFRATLTLPGIAGIVLSVGMAVDSNVLIFERMREESALGKSIRASVEAGYDKALWTIIDSHVTTLITAVALFLFGTGPIKGFAVTLSIGVLFNLFTALYGTRVVYDYLNFKRRLKSLRFLQLIGHTRIDFIRLKNFAFLFSGVLVISGLIAFVQIERGKGNLGVDFAGGTLIQFRADKAFTLDSVRTALSRRNLSDYELQEVPREHILIVRTKSVGSADRIAEILAADLPGQHFVLEGKSEIGPSVSRDLKRAALIAIAISLAGIVVYLAWRFDRRFGVAAAIATFHDVLTVLGIFYLLDKEITLLVVTALLTLAGYSLTDTVVVFDRIRENMHKKGRQDSKEVINRSINEVLSRTVITSGTVLLVLLALLLTGGVLLRDFALALLIGVIVGTYSSVFVASPIVYIWPAAGKTRKNPVMAGRRH